MQPTISGKTTKDATEFLIEGPGGTAVIVGPRVGLTGSYHATVRYAADCGRPETRIVEDADQFLVFGAACREVCGGDFRAFHQLFHGLVELQNDIDFWIGFVRTLASFPEPSAN